ncbi:hypothetical protein A3D77_01410 [Candidatus Gottesmanbacteria bacterium RIFCSPHIGHO2_02_FULL_39_11]|uniref:PIN domain-containing protein n=1 Tax=Candidatus Gottesmanbacteria bacterium RIFCSPHIGHO2_02_FULL_39_11 TaxID=1798382 RepID=A0A1F5ZUB8_9BACT|nr:MAG: hypothetical protein A3D77_01410 [Candidatus Gottesmanbacteria bacterium RIFCSPHIGHO2_02_FULL_39_11]
MIKKVYLDANILIAHQVSGHEFHERAKKIIDNLWSENAFLLISALTMDEFLYGIVFLLRGEKNDNSFGSFASILSKTVQAVLSWNTTRLIEFENSEDSLINILDSIKTYNLRPRDAFHLECMKQNKVFAIATFDNDFNPLSKNEKITVIQ